MFAMPGLRSFSLAAEPDVGRVSCGASGLFVGDVPLLQKHSAGGGHATWTVGPIAELNRDLSVRYRLPVDIGAKANALALVVHALNRGDFAMAAIAAVQMQLPDPPPLSKDIESLAELKRRAAELYRSALLKFWDPAKHPRTGTPPNPGWFAPVQGGEAESPDVIPVAMPWPPWQKPDIVEGDGAGGVPRGTLEFFPSGSPRRSPIEPAEEPAAPSEPPVSTPTPGAANPIDIVAPGGNPIGTPGSTGIREVPGGAQAAAQDLFNKLTQGAVPYTPVTPYDGTMYQLPGGGFVGLRMNSESGGPAIDLNISGLGIRRLHFPE